MWSPCLRECIGKAAAATIEWETLFVEMVRQYHFVKVETEPVIEDLNLVL